MVKIPKPWHLEFEATTRDPALARDAKLRVTIVAGRLAAGQSVWSEDVDPSAERVKWQHTFDPGEYVINAQHVGPAEGARAVAWQAIVVAGR
jgi:hypothetical protein